MHEGRAVTSQCGTQHLLTRNAGQQGALAVLGGVFHGLLYTDQIVVLGKACRTDTEAVILCIMHGDRKRAVWELAS